VRGRADDRFVVAWDLPGVETPPDRMKWLTRLINETGEPKLGPRNADAWSSWPKLVAVTGIRMNGETATAGVDWYYVDTVAGFTTARPQHSIYYFSWSKNGWQLDGSISYACWGDNGDGRAFPNAPRRRYSKPPSPTDDAPALATEPDRGWTEIEVLRVGGDVLPPKPLSHVDPEYSPASRRAHREGAVTLWVVVTPEGEVKNIHVARSAGPELDEAVIKAASQWTYEPATVNGRPVTVQLGVVATFKLDK